MPAIHERQQTEAPCEVRQAIFRAQQQKNIARFDRQRPDLFAKPFSLARDADQRHAIPIQQANGPCRAAGEPRGFRHEHFLQDEALAAELALSLADILELQRTEGLLDAIRTGLENKDVVGLDLDHAGVAGHPAAVPDQPDDLDVDLLRLLVEVTNAPADDGGAFADLDLGDIVLEIEQVLAGVGRLAFLRQQSPADESHVSDADDCAGEPDRREIEHAIRGAERVAAVLGDDDIRRRTDQRDHAAKNRGERQRHQGQRRAAAGLFCRLHVDGHEQGQCSHVVHDGGEAGRQPGHDRDVRGEFARCIDDDARHELDCTRVRQASADDEYQRNDDGGRMSKSGKGLIFRHYSGQDGDQERDEGNEVVTPSSPDKENKHEGAESKHQQLVLRHRHAFSLRNAGRLTGREDQFRSAMEHWIIR